MTDCDPTQSTRRFDLLVVGGGINGAGIARDAAGRGLDVALCEQGDLAGHTSSASTKLIHGGLRYLEYYEFSLVRKALQEREVLLGIAPHIIWPLRFVMPHVRDLRPAWMIRLGLFLYDHLGGRQRLPASSGVRLHKHPAGGPLDASLTRGFVYSDCWVQDARLVIVNAQDAVERGAVVWPRTRCVSAERAGDHWRATLESAVTGERFGIQARAVVNAGGPWVSHFLGASGLPAAQEVHLVKGSHIVVRRLFDHEYAYIFQHSDRRIIFAIPYEGDFTLIGTTDVAYSGDPALATASAEEIDYLCDAVNRYFERSVTAADVVWSYSGVRALHDDAATGDAAALSRDYALELDADGPPLLTVYGGKITTYRTLANEALERLASCLGVRRAAWTGSAALPGGDLPGGDFEAFVRALQAEKPWLPATLTRRLARNYGTRAQRILAEAESLQGLGEHFGADLYAAEVDYLVDSEWAQSAEDVLWRRSKLGLQLSAAQAQRLATYVANYLAVRRAAESQTA